MGLLSPADRADRVIIIDDDEAFAAFAAELLARLGFPSLSFPDATRADLAALRTAPCLLLDLDLPGMDGVEFMRMLKGLGMRTPIILMSALPRRTLEAAAAAGRSFGLDIAGAIHKPFTVREFHEVMGRILAGPEATHAPVPVDAPAILDAFDRGGLEAYFQPKVVLQGGSLIGWEALARLNMPSGEVLAPGVFLDVLAAATQFDLLTDRMLVLSITHWRRTRRALPDAHISVNLPASRLRDHDYPDLVACLLKHWGMPASKLTLEVTESELLEADAATMESLARLALLGVHLSIDDFGTGFSSFAQLSQLPCKELKIDRSFVMNLTTDEHAEVIVARTIELARELGMRVTAEGVEHPRQAELLKLMGCELGQGYMFGRPAPGTTPAAACA